jgi:hypothetical protein
MARKKSGLAITHRDDQAILRRCVGNAFRNQTTTSLEPITERSVPREVTFEFAKPPNIEFKLDGV